MAGFLLTIALVLASMTPPLYADNMLSRDLRVTDADGQAMVYAAENPKIPVPLNEETPLSEGDIVQTDVQSHAELTLDGETVIKLQPETTFKIEKILVKNTQLTISQGGLIAKVKPVTEPMQGIILKLPTAVVAVRGTEFAIDTKDNVSHVGVFDEGHVVVAGAWGHEHVKLAPNQETEVPLSNVPRPPQSLSHFKAQRSQMAQVRSRVAFWRKHWTPMTAEHRKLLRDHLTGPHRRPPKGFLRTPVKPIAHHARVSRHHAHKALPKKHSVSTHRIRKQAHPAADQNQN